MTGRGKRRAVAVALVVALAGYAAVFSGEYSLLDVRRTKAELADMRVELDSLRTVTTALRAKVDSLENDNFVLERLAREEHGMIREGDLLYRFVEPQDTSERNP